MKLHWTVEARHERRVIREHIALDNPAAALALDEIFSDKARNLIRHPAMGRPGRAKGTRELVVHPNYVLIYDVADDNVRILRVLHARRHWPPSDDEGDLD